MRLLKLQIIGFVLIFFTGSISAQSLWKTFEIDKMEQEPSELVQYIQEYSAVSVDYNHLFDALKLAPNEFTSRGISMDFPMPDGSLREFEVFYSPIMAPGLAERYPMIRNYKIISKDSEKIVGRIGVGEKGFHGSILTKEGRVYIDTYADNQKENYVSYYTKDYTKTMENLPSCGVSSEMNDEFLKDFEMDSDFGIDAGLINTRTPEGDVTLRTYRLAIGCTGEFGQTKGGTVEAVLSVMNQSVTKINEIFENEAAIRMILIEDNDKLIHLNGSTDPYSNPNMGGQLIGQNTSVLAAIIGLNTFDIGHVYTNSCLDVGGIASLGSVCSSNSKGNGVTCHYSSNVDLISVRVACHEMGHQFAASHTFNNCDEENESSGTAYEPGSGSTIMSYAGGCGPLKNVQGEPDPYFHGFSVEQMTYFSRDGNGDNCASYIETTNTHPVVSLDYTDGFSIPLLTPFRLTGEATDAEGDNLTYCWEEFDLGPLSLLGSPIGDAPQFRTFTPNPSSTRVLPAMQKIISNSYEFTEVLPFFYKDMTWRLTVRDNNMQGGGAEWKEVQFYAVEEAGPFLVQYPNSLEEFTVGQEYEILWDVANTDGEEVNEQFVNILLSTDGGYNYEHVLKSFTANDGSETVTIPNAITNTARIMIEAAGNIFFDISNSNFKINEATEPGFSAVIVPGYQDICLPANISVDINTEKYLDYNDDITLEVVSGLPAGAIATFANNPIAPGEKAELNIDANGVTVSGEFNVMIQVVSGSSTSFLSTILDLTSSDYSELAVISPAPGESGIPQVFSFSWEEDDDADQYIFELSDDPSFVGGETNVYKAGLTETTFSPFEPLFKNKVYFWRVTGVNKCGTGFTTAISTFSSEALSCKEYEETAVPINIPSASASTIDIETIIVTTGLVSDVNIRKLKGTHVYFKDLTAKLISPSGTEVSLFDKKCLGATSFDCGFDMESPLEISCPMINGIIFEPEGDLSVFNGEELSGKWILRIEDTKDGDGGKVNQYVLDICSNGSLSAPYLVTNTKLQLTYGQSDLINQGRLLVGDDDSDPDDLKYTLVEIPQYGELQLNSVAMEVGSIFYQEDLNENKIRFVHTDTDNTPVQDAFVFVVDDGEGGWIDLTTFIIEIDETINTEIEKAFDVSIYPNPAKDYINIILDDININNFQLEITDILGRTILNESYNSESRVKLNVSDFTSGNYFFKVTIEDSSQVYKIELIK